MHVLRRVHELTTPGGALLEAHPLRSRAPVEAGGHVLGRLDDAEFGATIRALDEAVEQVVAEGLYALEAEAELDVLDRFDDAAEAVETARGWRGLRVPDEVAAAVLAAEPPIDVRQRVIYRHYRRLPG